MRLRRGGEQAPFSQKRMAYSPEPGSVVYHSKDGISPVSDPLGSDFWPLAVTFGILLMSWR